MQNIASIISTIILASISGIHFYWAFGGKWATDAVLPQTENEALVFKPGIVPTLMVAIVFAVAILFPLAILEINFFDIPPKILRGGIFAMAVVFGLRAIGEFRYVGFFKKIKNTTFGKNDTRYYSPLCLFMSVLNAIIVLLNF
jgi:hypothetical protein